MIDKQSVLDRLDLSNYYRSVLISLKANGSMEATGLCPFHKDLNPSFSVNLDTGLWHCFTGCGGGDIFSFYMKLHGVDFLTALKDLAGIAGVTVVSDKKIVAAYDYRDENGALLYQKLRYTNKVFSFRHKGPNGWIENVKGVRRVVYNLPELVNASGAVIVEGEKDADNLKALGYAGTTAVTTTDTGAKERWKQEHSGYFLSKQVAIIPDNDHPGLGYAEEIARNLHGKASVIKIVELPGLGERTEDHGLDVSDWIDLFRKEGRTDKEIKAELTRLIREAPAWEPNADVPQEEPSGLVMLDTVTPEAVDWLWEGHIPLGKLTVLDGDPGLGKSTVTLDLIARVSRGASMPDGSPGVSGGAVLLNHEDGLADTIVPRLKATGADLSRILSVQSVQDENGNQRFPSVKDIKAMRQACDKVQAKIVVIDPIMAHLDGKVNSWRDQDIRGALTPLCKLADEIGVAVIIVRHLNKASGGQAIYRGGGSIGIIGAARCAFLVAKDPEDEDRRIFAGVKNNLAPMPPSLSFSIEEVDGASRIAWGGVSNHKADALLALPSSPEERTALDEAKEFLRDLLFNGPVESKGVKKEAKAAGIADATLRRAKKVLGIKVEKHGYQGAWVWALPAKDAQDSQRCSLNNDEHLWGEVSTFEEKETPKPPDKTPWAVEI